MRALVRLINVVALVAACGGGQASAPDAASVADTAPAAAVASPVDTTPPRGRRGMLIARSATPGPLSGEWRPAAGMCGSPPTLQLVARGDSVDVIVLLRLPENGPATGAYRVAGPQDTVAGPGTARIGVQRLLYVERAYRSERGAVELQRLDRLASGRFDVVLRELNAIDTVRYLGVFERIRLDSLPGAQCQLAPGGLPPGVH